jgi:hypothetical protein
MPYAGERLALLVAVAPRRRATLVAAALDAAPLECARLAQQQPLPAETLLLGIAALAAATATTPVAIAAAPSAHAAAAHTPHARAVHGTPRDLL